VNVLALSLFWILGAQSGAPDPGVACAESEAQLRRQLIGTEVQMEPAAARLRVHEAADQALQSCPHSEGIAYLSVRAAELVPPDDDDPTFSKFLDRLMGRFPKSARIATVKARWDKTLVSAQRAAALDGTYGPAQVVLAQALLRAGDVAGADAAIKRVKDLAHLDDGFAVLAQVKWAQGDLDGAMESARKELSGGRVDPTVEPISDAALAIARAHEILGYAYLRLGKAEKAVPHLREAAWASPKVKELLRNPDPVLKKAMARQHQPKPPSRD
jgi:tetratricopeptide (TPR) repeat protein